MFNVEALRARLRAANDTAESIQSTAQWIFFYKRHARSIAEEWCDAVVEDANKLADIYIANEVVQQSKIKRRGELVDEFSRVMPDAVAAAYAASDEKLKDKIGRVVKVWRQRLIFSPEAQQAIEDSMSASTEYPYELVPLVRSFAQLKAASPSATEFGALSDAVLAELESLRTKVLMMSEMRSPPVEPGAGGEPAQPAGADAGEVYTAQTATGAGNFAASLSGQTSQLDLNGPPNPLGPDYGAVQYDD